MAADGAETTRFCRAMCVGLATALTCAALVPIVQRLSFDFDLNFWSEDYLLTSLAQLHAGTPMYSRVEDAASNVYSPGTALLHHAVLAPFDASTSVTANRVLAQFVQLVALLVGARFSVVFAQQAGGWPKRRASQIQYVGLVAMFLMLSAYSNPVVDGLHPTNLESLALSLTVLGIFRLRMMDAAERATWLAILPALAALSKQTAGIAVATSLVVAVLTLRLPTPWRLAWASLPAVAAFAVLCVVNSASGGWFWTWGFEILAAHPWHWSKLSNIYRGVGPLYVPVVAVVAIRAGVAIGRRTSFDCAFLRALLVPVFYAPFAVAALLKAGGGPNNLSSLGHCFALLAGPVLLKATYSNAKHRLGLVAAGTLSAQLLLWWPRRQAPSERDRALAAQACRYAESHLRCGEHVWLGRGASCYARAGRLPTDRMNAIREVLVAGRFGELGITRSVANGRYDLIMLHQADLTQLGPRFWRVLDARYRLFAASDEAPTGDYWADGLQAWGSRRVLFYERKSERGRHSPDLAHGCRSEPTQRD